MAGTSSSITQGDPPVAQFEDALSWLLLNSDNITPAQGEIDSSIPLKFESDVAQNNPAPIPPLALSSAYLKPPPVSGAETPNLTAVEKAALEKKRLRLEKNRQSARECRKRKREMNLQEQTRIKQLERENAELRLQMKVGNEAIATEEKEKREMIAELEKLIGKKSSEEEIKSKLKTFMDRHADYGKGPKSALQYHLSQAERLLIPTQTTKMALWTVHQSRIDQAKREEEERHSQALGLADSQPAPLPMSMSMVESLSTILARELDMTEEQKGIFESKQESTRELIGELHVTLQVHGAQTHSAGAQCRRIVQCRSTVQIHSTGT